jgi:hypothetical protein
VLVGAPAVLSAAPALAEEVTVSPETSATISPALMPAKAGAAATFRLTINFSGGNFGVPAQVSRVVLHMPAGLRLVEHGVGVCSRARLVARGAQGCPKADRVGAGHALMVVHAGAANITEEANILTFLGPSHNGIPSIEVMGQGETPLEERVVLSGTFAPDQAPFGESLTLPVPPIPTVPLEPNASTISTTMTVGVRRHGKVAVGVILPRKCPAGGLPFAADFSYENGTTSHTTARVGCH